MFVVSEQSRHVPQDERSRPDESQMVALSVCMLFQGDVVDERTSEADESNDGLDRMLGYFRVISIWITR